MLVISFLLAKQVSAKSIELSAIKQQLTSIQWHTLVTSNDWRFKVETILERPEKPTQQRIQTFNPMLEPTLQWQLLEQDKKQPTQAMLSEYAKIQQGLLEEKSTEPLHNSHIIAQQTLQFKREDDQFLYYAFNPDLPMFNDDINRVLVGELKVSKVKTAIESIEIYNSTDFSPSFSFNIKKFTLRVKFSEINGQFHVVELVSRKIGTAFFITDFNETSTRLVSAIELTKK